MLLQERVVKLRLTKPNNYLEFEGLVIFKEQLKTITSDHGNKKRAGEFPLLF